MALAFGFLWTYITRRRQALGVELSDEEIRRTTITFLVGNPLYAIAVIVAFISPAVVLVIIAALALYYMIIGMRSPELR
jgi:hypothetical protein